MTGGGRKGRVNPGGLKDGSPLAGAKGSAPVGGLGDFVSRS